MSFIFGQVSFTDAPVDRERFYALSLTNHARCAPAHVMEDSAGACLAVASAAGQGGAGPVLAALDGALHDSVADLGNADGARDSTVVAAAWARWGQEMFSRLLGDYAGCVYDPGARRVALFRDHIGTRPLYWHWDGVRLSVASFLPDLLALLPHAPAPHEEAIAALLRVPTALTPYTLLSGIHSVRPGHAVMVDASGPQSLRWWVPEDVPDIRFKRRAEYAEAFRDLTDRAIADRLGGMGPIGAHLSGGIDSTGVALLGQQHLAQAGRGLGAVYSWSPALSPEAPDMGAMDERPRILEICEAAGLTPRFGRLTGEAKRAFFTRPLELDGPADLLEELDILDQAQADGMQTLLSGWGGDEAFSAHAVSVPAGMLAQGQLGALFRLARSHFGLRRPHRMAGFVWSRAIVPLLPDTLFDRFGPYSDLYQDIYISDRLARLPRLPDRPVGARLTGDPIRDLRAHIDQRHIGERMATWAAWSAPYGIEYRYPLTDRRLMDFVLGVPPDILWGDGRPRYLARTALTGRIKGRLSKSDPANEHKRLKAARGAWRIVAAEAAAGRFDGACDWLDMDTLRPDLQRGPSGDDTKDLMTFIRIFPALRIWHMAERFGAIDHPTKRRAAE